VFFFQAEDGIREFHVTGVQTCALPIYIMGNPPFIGKKEQTKEQKNHFDLVMGSIHNSGLLDFVSAWYVKAVRYLANRHSREGGRSEERRVGKECRSRWRPSQV